MNSVLTPQRRDEIVADGGRQLRRRGPWRRFRDVSLLVIAALVLLGYVRSCSALDTANTQIGQLQDQVRNLGGTPVAGPQGAAGRAGVGITRVAVVDGDLVVHYSSGRAVDVGTVVGPAGSAGAPGKNGRNGVNGSPGKDGAPGRNGTNGINGTNGADGKDGRDGVSITATAIDDNGHLLVLFSNGTDSDVGRVVGPAGRSVSSVDISADGHLIVTYSDGRMQDAGTLPTGPVCPAGYAAQARAAPPPYLGETWTVCVQS